MYETELEISFAIDFLDKEIEYAESCLQPHDTGHIHTAISWMKSRRTELEKQYTVLSSAG